MKILDMCFIAQSMNRELAHLLDFLLQLIIVNYICVVMNYTCSALALALIPLK